MEEIWEVEKHIKSSRLLRPYLILEGFLSDKFHGLQMRMEGVYNGQGSFQQILNDEAHGNIVRKSDSISDIYKFAIASNWHHFQC